MKKTLTIEGMSCGHCVKHTTDALEGLDGVSQVAVDLEKKTAVLEAEGSVTDDMLQNAVKEAGYSVTSIN